MLLDDLIESTQAKLERIQLPETCYDLSDYTHGRCHLFALALHLELGYDMIFLWDDDYWFDGDDAPSIVLVHAYCVLPLGKPFKGKYVDARGAVSLRMIEREYEFNSEVAEETSSQQLDSMINNGRLGNPDKGEIQALRQFIRKHLNRY